MLGDEGRKCRFCSGRHGDQPAADACREEWLAEQRRAPWLDRSRMRAEQEAMEQAEQDADYDEAQEQQARPEPEPQKVIHLGEEWGYISNGKYSPPDPRKDGTCGQPEWLRLAMQSEPTGTLEHLD